VSHHELWEGTKFHRMHFCNVRIKLFDFFFFFNIVDILSNSLNTNIQTTIYLYVILIFIDDLRINTNAKGQNIYCI
jgi:hypothetical protein